MNRRRECGDFNGPREWNAGPVLIGAAGGVPIGGAVVHVIGQELA